MGILSDKDKKVIKQRLDDLEKPVKMIFFTQTFECQLCKETGMLAKELSELSDKITFEEYNFIEDKDAVKKWGVNKIPALVISDESDKDYGIKFYGIPSGYEFNSLLSALMMVSTGNVDLSEKTLERLSHINQPVLIQVFVTPTCPYCPRAVEMAHKMAFVNENISAHMIEAQEFPTLVQRYQVMGVPKTVVNDEIEFEGAVPETVFLKNVVEAAKKMGVEFPAEPKIETKPGDPVIVTDDTFESEVLNSDIPVLVDFWAEWCMPCKALAPTVKKLAKEYEGKVKVAKLDTDENPITAQKYGIQSIPTLLIFKNGEVVEQLVGLQPKHVFDNILKKFI